MKKKTLKIILIVEVVVVIALGVTVFMLKNSHLGSFTSNSYTIDITEPFDINDYLEVKEGVDVSYELDVDNSQLVAYLTKGDKEETITADVTILYPQVVVADDITIDPYVGYDIDDYVQADEGVTVTSELDVPEGSFTSGTLTITYSKGDYTNTITKEVNIRSTDPRMNIRYYDCKNVRGVKYQMILYPIGTLTEVTSSETHKGYYTMTDNNNGEMYDMDNWSSKWTRGIYISDDNQEASFYIVSGSSSKDTCTLSEVQSVY